MPLSQEDIQAIVKELKSQILTARIPELPDYKVFAEDIAPDDLIPIFQKSSNKTVKLPFSEARIWMETGGNLSHAPIINGISAIVQVGGLQAGTKTFYIPQVAGKEFVLRRNGVGAMNPGDPLLPDDPMREYEILDSGGFRLTRPDDVLTEGEWFELQFKESGPGGVGVGQVTGGAGGIRGVRVINTNSPLSAEDAGKICQFRAGDAAVRATLPPIETVPENSEFRFETMIGNENQNVVDTSEGQNIYFNDTSLQEIEMGLSEFLHLYRGEDGWYVMNDFSNYLHVGEIHFKHKVGLNEFILNGGVASRTALSRAWKYANSTAASIVSEQLWQTTLPDGTRPYRGCFSYGDGVNNFRFPDFMGMSIRAVIALAGNDPLRQYNKPGGYQKDGVGPFTGTFKVPKGWGYTGNQTNNGVIANGDPLNGHGSLEDIVGVAVTTAQGETTTKNIGLIPVLKI